MEHQTFHWVEDSDVEEEEEELVPRGRTQAEGTSSTPNAEVSIIEDSSASEPKMMKVSKPEASASNKGKEKILTPPSSPAETVRMTRSRGKQHFGIKFLSRIKNCIVSF